MGGFVLGFVVCLVAYAVLVGVLSIIQYQKKKKERVNAQDKKEDKEA